MAAMAAVKDTKRTTCCILPAMVQPANRREVCVAMFSPLLVRNRDLIRLECSPINVAKVCCRLTTEALTTQLPQLLVGA